MDKGGVNEMEKKGLIRLGNSWQDKYALATADLEAFCFCRDLTAAELLFSHRGENSSVLSRP